MDGDEVLRGFLEAIYEGMENVVSPALREMVDRVAVGEGFEPPSPGGDTA